MQALLDTNVLIHREAGTVVRADIGTLFLWLDKLRYDKLIHPASLKEIETHADPRVVQTLKRKLGSYEVLKTVSADTPGIAAIRTTDTTPNDVADTSILAEIAADRADLLITEDRGIHRKAEILGLAARVYTIEAFLEKVTAEHPDQADYKVLSVRKRLMGTVDVSDPFFDSFREDYPGFDSWFRRKANETSYVCSDDMNRLLAFLYLKLETPMDDVGAINPPFPPRRRLKIGTFKVVVNGFKLGERFLKIVFDHARHAGVEEIYVTLFRRTSEHDRLALLLEDWGFERHGIKNESELVYVRPFAPRFELADPRRTYPFVSLSVSKFVVPIYPEYHTELLPDSILRTENPKEYVDNKPNRNAISKVYISRSIERGLKRGDIIVFYRTKSDAAPAYYTAVITTMGIVMDVITDLHSKDAFIAACRKRSVFSDEALAKQWDYKPHMRPFVVNFLYVHTFSRKPNRKQLMEAKIINDAPRGFERLTDSAFQQLLEVANADKRLVVD